MAILDTLKFILKHPLNRDRKLDALVRFVRWQIGSRIIPGDVVYQWIDQSVILAHAGETGVTGNIYCGLHEYQDMGFLLHVLREEDLFFDVGANIGSYTVLASAVVGAKSCCFEPVPSTSDLPASPKIQPLTH